MSLSDNCKALLKRAVDHTPLSDSLLEDFGKLFERLVSLNSIINVTAVTDEPGVTLKHIADSLSPMCLEEFKALKASLCYDIGCGGGFPGLPLALANPQMKITMIDSTEKKIRALEESVEILGLKNTRCISGRAEELSCKGSAHREKGDLVFSRALARLDMLCELCMPFVKVGGYFIALKGKDAPTELEEAKNAIKLLGGKLVRMQETTLSPSCFEGLELTPEEKAAADEFAQSKRYLVIIKKTSPTQDKYPRPFAQIKKKKL